MGRLNRNRRLEIPKPKTVSSFPDVAYTYEIRRIFRENGEFRKRSVTRSVWHRRAKRLEIKTRKEQIPNTQNKKFCSAAEEMFITFLTKSDKYPTRRRPK